MIDGKHNILAEFVEKETNPYSHNTRAFSHNLLSSISTNTSTYFYSFLPRTIRDLRVNMEETP